MKGSHAFIVFRAPPVLAGDASALVRSVRDGASPTVHHIAGNGTSLDKIKARKCCQTVLPYRTQHRLPFGADGQPGGIADQFIDQPGRQQRCRKRPAAFAENPCQAACGKAPSAPHAGSSWRFDLVWQAIGSAPSPRQASHKGGFGIGAMTDPDRHIARGSGKLAIQRQVQPTAQHDPHRLMRDTQARARSATDHPPAPCRRRPSRHHGLRAAECTCRRASGPVIH